MTPLESVAVSLGFRADEIGAVEGFFDALVALGIDPHAFALASSVAVIAVASGLLKRVSRQTAEATITR